MGIKHTDKPHDTFHSFVIVHVDLILQGGGQNMTVELVDRQVKPSYGESDNVIDMSHIDLKEISDVKRYYSLLQELFTITGRPILLTAQK